MLNKTPFSYEVVDAGPFGGSLGGACGVWDLDGDGRLEMVVGGDRGLYWYSAAERARHLIDDTLWFDIGMGAHDITGDGRLNVVVATWFHPIDDRPSSGHALVWYEAPAELCGPWIRHTIDADRAGSGHDLVIADLDGDGADEILVVAVDSAVIDWYRIPDDPRNDPWPKYTIDLSGKCEGLAVADITGNGSLDVVCGPSWYEQPADPEARTWQAHAIAPHYRDFCRVQAADLDGDGTAEIVLAEAEYGDGRVGVFKSTTGGASWTEHLLAEGPFYFPHTLQVVDLDGDGRLDILVAEMSHGGFGAEPHLRPRFLAYRNQGGSPESWEASLLHEGIGSHEAKAADFDGDGELEVVGKSWKNPSEVQVLRRSGSQPAFPKFRHSFLDTGKEEVALQIMAAELENHRDGVICGNHYYERAPDGWTRRTFPGVSQVIARADVDGDGRVELICTTGGALNNELCWLKRDMSQPWEWTQHHIGVCDGDFPSGVAVVAGLPGQRKPGLITGYHDVLDGKWPEIWTIPDEATEPWSKKVLAEIAYGEEFAVADLTGNGVPDIVAGCYWLEWQGGTWEVHAISEGVAAGRVACVRVADINGDGRPDIVIAEENVDYRTRTAGLGRIAWFEAPADPRRPDWVEHLIALRTSPHSLDVADLDGDGEPEILVGEHDPFGANSPDASCRLLAYKAVDASRSAWSEHVLDDRFEHHNGARAIPLGGEIGIVSHGWAESDYVHLWTKAEAH
jgi:hypothetical protein